MKMNEKNLAYKMKGKMIEYLPHILHASGTVLSVASGVPSVPRNPGYSFNMAVGCLLGYEALPSKKSKEFPPSSRYDGLVGAYRGITASRNVKMLFGGALAAMSIWLYAQGNIHAAMENGLFDLGLLLSVAGSEIERKKVLKILKE